MLRSISLFALMIVAIPASAEDTKREPVAAARAEKDISRPETKTERDDDVPVAAVTAPASGEAASTPDFEMQLQRLVKALDGLVAERNHSTEPGPFDRRLQNDIQKLRREIDNDLRSRLAEADKRIEGKKQELGQLQAQKSNFAKILDTESAALLDPEIRNLYEDIQSLISEKFRVFKLEAELTPMLLGSLTNDVERRNVIQDRIRRWESRLSELPKTAHQDGSSNEIRNHSTSLNDARESFIKGEIRRLLKERSALALAEKGDLVAKTLPSGPLLGPSRKRTDNVAEADATPAASLREPTKSDSNLAEPGPVTSEAVPPSPTPTSSVSTVDIPGPKPSPAEPARSETSATPIGPAASGAAPLPPPPSERSVNAIHRTKRLRAIEQRMSELKKQIAGLNNEMHELGNTLDADFLRETIGPELNESTLELRALVQERATLRRELRQEQKERASQTPPESSAQPESSVIEFDFDLGEGRRFGLTGPAHEILERIREMRDAPQHSDEAWEFKIRDAIRQAGPGKLPRIHVFRHKADAGPGRVDRGEHDRPRRDDDHGRDSGGGARIELGPSSSRGGAIHRDEEVEEFLEGGEVRRRIEKLDGPRHDDPIREEKEQIRALHERIRTHAGPPIDPATRDVLKELKALRKEVQATRDDVAELRKIVEKSQDPKPAAGAALRHPGPMVPAFSDQPVGIVVPATPTVPVPQPGATTSGDVIIPAPANPVVIPLPAAPRVDGPGPGVVPVLPGIPAVPAKPAAPAAEPVPAPIPGAAANPNEHRPIESNSRHTANPLLHPSFPTTEYVEVQGKPVTIPVTRFVPFSAMQSRPGNEQIEQHLAVTSVTMSMKNSSLYKILMRIGAQANVRIEIDNKALGSVNNPARFDRNDFAIDAKRKTAAKALSELLEPLGLSYCVQEGAVTITTKDAATRKLMRGGTVSGER